MLYNLPKLFYLFKMIIRKDSFLALAGRYMMTSWENYEDFLQKLGVSLLLRKLATLGTPIVEVKIIVEIDRIC